jgi:hypothetical protein
MNMITTINRNISMNNIVNIMSIHSHNYEQIHEQDHDHKKNGRGASNNKMGRLLLNLRV